MSTAKCLSSLRPIDLATSHVWRHKRAEDLLAHEDESFVEPVALYPVSDAYDHYFSTNIRLNDGTEEVALIGKTEPTSPALNAISQFFLFYRSNLLHEWTDDPLRCDPTARDPALLAQFLGKQVHEVFPFRYDISQFVKGDPNVVMRLVVPTHSSEVAPETVFEAAVQSAIRTTLPSESGDDA